MRKICGAISSTRASMEASYNQRATLLVLIAENLQDV